MSYADNPYRYSEAGLAALADVDERSAFIRKTYANLAGAVLAFVALEGLLLSLPGIERVATLAVRGWNWAIVLGAFLLVSFVAERWARSSVSLGKQYAGLYLYVAAESVLFVPLLYFANRFDAQIIPTAGLATLVIFGGLTAAVFITKRDFSFLRTALYLAGFAAFGLVIAAAVFGFSLGLVFSVAMVALAGGYILYDTSNVLHHYRIGQHVAAALALFASVALLFYYVVRIVWALQSRD